MTSNLRNLLSEPFRCRKAGVPPSAKGFTAVSEIRLNRDEIFLKI